MLKPKEEIVEIKKFAKAVGVGPLDLWEKFRKYGKLTINDEMKPFTEEILEAQENKAEYGVLELLEGTWVSYKSDNDKEKGRIGTGVHTTIMPSPGVNLGTIPGKYSFECEEYIEALTFSLVPGGIRNRGGVSEQFCGAIKYEQSIKSVNTVEGQKALKYTPIHEENGMYLWLSDLYNHAATAKSIEEDRGILSQSEEDRIKYKFKGEYKDETLVKIKNDQGIFEYIAISQLKKGQKYYSVVPAKELKPGFGLDGPYFIPDYSISRSGVIPHGSTITLLGDLVSQKGKYVIGGAPEFPKGLEAWDFDHLSISPTMGGADTRHDGPINLDDPAPKWVHEKLTHENDPRENKIYTQRILAHELYPYSVRPDLRLRDSIKGEEIDEYISIHMSSKNKTGAQGGILNVPFVNRFVPTVEMNMNMWVQRVHDKVLNKKVLQLQYEQIVFFEFNFGDDGGTTSWPHIQVNTLRKIEDVPTEQKELIEEQFKGIKKTDDSNKAEYSISDSKCPYHKE